MTENRTVYIYALKEKGSEDVRYIGQSENPGKRFLGHMALRDVADGNKKLLWIKSVLENNSEIEFSVIDQCDIEQSAERETYWIDYYTGLGCDLTNTARKGNRSRSNAFKERGIFSQEKRTQACVSSIGEMKDVLDAARGDFPDSRSDAKALENALRQWWEWETSKRASLGRLEECNAKILAIVTQQDARLRAIEANMLDLLRERKIVPEKKS